MTHSAAASVPPRMALPSLCAARRGLTRDISAAAAGLRKAICQTARNVDPQSASKTDPALREVFGSLGPAIAEICGAGSGSTPTDLRVLPPSWSGVIC